MNATSLLLALLAPFLADTVTTRQGKKHEGRILDYPQHIEVVPADGKKVAILKGDIAHIEIAPNLIECPEIVPFPFDLVEKAAYDYLSFERTLVCIPRPPGRKIVAIDILPKVQKVWDIDLPDRVGDPIFCGRTLHFIQREEFLDDSKKIRFGAGGVPVSKKICRLTVHAVDLGTGQTSWKLVIDNNDRKDLLWELPQTAPTLFVGPERAILRVLKTGWPMTPKGEVDKSNTKTFVTVYTYDTKAGKLIDTVDIMESLDLKSRIFLVEDQMILLTYTGGARFTLLSVGALDGKVKWKTEEIPGRIFDVVGDQAYAVDRTHLYAYSVKTGKALDKWSIQHSDGTIEAIDHNFVYYYRRRQEPRAIIGYDVRKAEKAFEIPMPERDDFKHEMLVGHRLLYTDRAQTLRVFDTLQKKLLWEWKGPGPGTLVNLSLVGSGLTFIKDGRVNHLDLNTGALAWAVRGNFRGIAPVGDAGALAHKLPMGTEILRRRITPPEGAKFFNASGTPLRFALGEDVWSAPALSGDLIYSIASSGTLYAIDPKKGDVAWSVKAAAAAPNPLLVPAAAKGRLAVYAGGSTHVYDTASKARLFQVSDVALRPDRATLTGDGLLTVTGAGVMLSDPETGKKLWDSQARRVRDFFLSGKKAYALTYTDIQEIDLATGETAETFKVPPNTSLVAVDGKRVFAAAGPHLVVEAVPRDECREVYKSSQQDLKVALRFKGALAAAGGKAIFSHAAGEVACFDPDARDDSKRTLWSFPAPDFTSALLVHGERVWFAAPGKGLLGLNAATGAVVWKADVSAASLFTPILHEGKPAFWSIEGWIMQAP